MPKYFLYARKSTDEEDRQVLSIEAQLAELREFAVKEKLEIVDSLCESKTAKEPGRTKFGEMLNRIEQGQADGIIAWHPDRLARNSIDGGKIIYLADKGIIKSLKFPTFWFESTPQGKFMLNIAFGQSKYYIDNLSENVKRGFRQKLRRGEYPSRAPLGYLNDLRTRTLVIDPKKYKLVKRIFELYSTSQYTIRDLADEFNKLGLTSQYENPTSVNIIHRLLQNPFYYGVFRYLGELHQGAHEPIITKKLFDKVQEVIKSRGKKRKIIKHDFVFTRLIRCVCGCSITAEIKKGHIYYRCTKKKGFCSQKYVRQELLLEQFVNLFKKVSISDVWADKMIKQIDKEKEDCLKSSFSLVNSSKEEVAEINNKLDRLLDDRLI